MMPATFPFQVGNFSCLAIMDSRQRYAVEMFLTNLPREQYEPLLHQSGQETQEIDVPYICLFIDTGHERVLVDTGIGLDGVGPSPGELLPLLQSEGIQPHEVGTVVLSHGHPDHIGGCLNKEGKPAFCNARSVMFRTEWDFWMSGPSLGELPVDESLKRMMLASARKNLLGIQRQLDLISEGTEIVPGITAIAAFGHSPGQMALEITSAEQRLLFVADAIIHPLHLEFPQAIAMTDHRPSQMVDTRIALLRKAVTEKSLVSTSHFAFPGLGRVVPKGKSWRWQPACGVDSPGLTA